MAGSRPATLTGGSSARTGPPGVPTSRHRSLAASWGCAANSAGERSRAQAMPAASSSAASRSAGTVRNASWRITVSSASWATRSGLVRNRPSVIRSGRCRIFSHSTAHSRSFCRPMNTCSPPATQYGP